MSSPSCSSPGRLAGQARVRAILRALPPAAARPVHARRSSPLDTLISTVLSQNTTDANSDAAFARLKARFPRWEMVARASPGQIAAAIRSGGLAGIKAARIKRILEQIQRDRGRLTLDFLADLPLSEASQYLRSLPGVGPKTAACVLLFAFDRPAFPVDTHVLRVSKRLGLLSPATTMERAHDLFAEMVPPQDMLPLHLGLVQHGRQVCKARRPRCQICPLAELCPRVGVAASAKRRAA